MSAVVYSDTHRFTIPNGTSTHLSDGHLHVSSDSATVAVFAPGSWASFFLADQGSTYSDPTGKDVEITIP